MLKLQNLKIVFPTLAIFVALVLVSVAPAATVTTSGNIPASNNQSYGNYFDLTNISSSPITLTGNFEGNFDPASNVFPGRVEVWWRNGTVADNYLTPTGWTLLGADDNVNANPVDMPTPVDVGNTLVIAPGDTKGILWNMEASSTPSVLPTKYTDGQHTVEDGTLRISGWAGKGFSKADPPISAGFEFRSWNGSVEYVPEPAALLMLVTAAPLMMGRRRRPT